MTSREKFNAFATSRGDGLHPRLRELLDRAAAEPFSEVVVRPDGMLQAGPDPKSEASAPQSKVSVVPVPAPGVGSRARKCRV
jgi:hypothetical protein